MAATIIGILLILFGAFKAFSLFQQSEVTGMEEIITVARLINGLCLLAYLTVGIALLRRSSWARKGAIIAIIANMALSLPLAMVVFLRIMPMMPPPAPGMPINLIMIISIAFSVLLSLGINGTLIYFLTRPNMIEAYDRKETTHV